MVVAQLTDSRVQENDGLWIPQYSVIDRPIAPMQQLMGKA
jgi:hypothetical protein